MEDYKEILDKLTALDSKIDEVNKNVEIKPVFTGGINPEPEVDNKQKFDKALRNLSSGNIKYIKIDKSVQNETTDTSGGFLVPIEAGAEMFSVINQYGIARKLSNVKSMNREKMTFPTFGKLVAYKISEAASATATLSTIGQITLQADKVVCFVPTTNELLNDSAYPLQSEILNLAGGAIAEKEDADFLTALAGATNSVSAGTTNISTSLTGVNGYDKLIDITSTLEAVNVNYLNGASWIMSPSVKGTIRKIKDSTGQPIFVSVANGTGLTETLLGYPVITTNGMPTASATAEAGKLYFGNFKIATLFGDRQSVELYIAKEGTISATESLLMNDMSAFRLITRYDVVLSRADAIVKLLNVA